MGRNCISTRKVSEKYEAEKCQANTWKKEAECMRLIPRNVHREANVVYLQERHFFWLEWYIFNCSVKANRCSPLYLRLINAQRSTKHPFNVTVIGREFPLTNEHTRHRPKFVWRQKEMAKQVYELLKINVSQALGVWYEYKYRTGPFRNDSSGINTTNNGSLIGLYSQDAHWKDISWYINHYAYEDPTFPSCSPLKCVAVFQEGNISSSNGARTVRAIFSESDKIGKRQLCVVPGRAPSIYDAGKQMRRFSEFLRPGWEQK